MAKSAIGSVYVNVLSSSIGLAKEIEEALSEAAKKGGGKASEEVVKPFKEKAEEIGEEIGGATQKGTEGGAKGGLKAAGGAMAGLVAAWGLKELIGGQIENAFAVETGNASVTAALALSEEERAKMEAVSKNLFYDAYGESQEEISKSIGTIIGSIKGARSASQEELEKMTKDILNLSATYDLSAEEIAKAGQIFVNLGSGTFQDFTDLTAKAFTNLGQAGAEDFLDTITEYGGSLKQAGLDSEEALAMFDNFIKAGVWNTDVVGDLIQEIGILSRAGASEEQELVFKKVGVDPKAFKAAALKGGDEFGQVWLDTMDKIVKNGDANDLMLFGGTKAEDFYQQIKSVDWKTVTDGSSMVANDMEKIDKTLNDTSAVSFEGISRSFQETLQGVMLPLLEKVLPMVEKFGKWVTENEKLAGIIGGALLVAMGAFTVAVAANAIAWMMNPMTWIVLGVVAAVALLAAGIYALIANWDSVSAAVGDFFGGIWTWIQNAGGWFAGLWNGFSNGAVTAWNTVTGKISEAWTWITTKVSEIISGSRELLAGFVSWVTGVGGSIKSFFSGVFNQVSTTISNIITRGKEILATVINWLTNAIGNIGSKFEAIFKGMVNMLSAPLNAIINGANYLINGLNSINFSIPDWVPEIGGNSFGLNIPNIPPIPALASGADILGPTLALVGEKDPETVVNRGVMNKTLSDMSRLIREVQGNNGTVTNNITINAREGQSPRAIVKEISRQAAWQAGRA